MESGVQDSLPDSEGLIHIFMEKCRFQNIVFSISHTDYRTVIGGTEKVIRAEKALFEKKNVSYLHIFPSFVPYMYSENNQVMGVSIDGNLVGTFPVSELCLVFEVLTGNGYFRPLACHLHHLMGISLKSVNYLIQAFHPPVIRFYIHDYYAICPQYNLLRDGEVFCGGPKVGSDICAGCSWGGNRDLHTKSFSDLFRKSSMEFIAPSQVAADIWNNCSPYNGTTIQVVPHLRLSEGQIQNTHISENPRRIRIAYVGYQSDKKGWKTWSRITEKINKEFYELFHIGAADEQLPGVMQIPLPLEKGGENPVSEKIRSLEIDIALLWSIWPETYSFTLFESLAANCFIITNPQSGNIAEVVQDRSAGMVFTTENEFLDFLKDYNQVRAIIKEFKTRCPHMNLSWNPAIVEETIGTRGEVVRADPSDSGGIVIDRGSSYILFQLESELRLREQISDQAARIEEKDSRLLQMEEQIRRLETDLHKINTELESSIVWQLITGFHSVFIDGGFPLGTGRRRLYDQALVFWKNLLLTKHQDEQK